jgi:anti-anti-sigma factor
MSTYDLELLDAPDPTITLVALSGELDLTNADDMHRRLDAFGAGGALVLDLSGVAFVDSAALHALFRVARERGRAGIAVVLDPRSPIAKTFEIVGFERLAPVCPSIDDALGTFA